MRIQLFTRFELLNYLTGTPGYTYNELKYKSNQELVNMVNDHIETEEIMENASSYMQTTF